VDVCQVETPGLAIVGIRVFAAEGSGPAWRASIRGAVPVTKSVLATLCTRTRIEHSSKRGPIHVPTRRPKHFRKLALDCQLRNWFSRKTDSRGRGLASRTNTALGTAIPGPSF
jgi:hypothetical protein